VVRDSQGAGRDLTDAPPARGGVPLLIVAELPQDVFAWADALRRAHYPPERNRMGAHVTLFHGLPPSAEPAVTALLSELAREPAPHAVITGLMDLDPGTAFAVDSPAMAALHGDMAERLHGLIQQRDARPLRLHITIQAKVAPGEARALQARLAPGFAARRFRFHGLGLYGWTGEAWVRRRVFAFRGS
jgi:hypothetical protein